VHWNEERVHLEPEWLDDERRRFQPIITDFSRTTQLVVRYRLDDVLVASPGPCPCGRPSRGLDAIAGRADDVLGAPPLGGGPPVAVFPDLLRRAFALVDGLRDYRLEQHGAEWRLRIDAADAGEVLAAMRAELTDLTRRLAVRLPALCVEDWRQEPLQDKRRRIRCVLRPGLEQN
jgi:putative adenylate-forming enzyme